MEVLLCFLFVCIFLVIIREKHKSVDIYIYTHISYRFIDEQLTIFSFWVGPKRSETRNLAPELSEFRGGFLVMCIPQGGPQKPVFK